MSPTRSEATRVAASARTRERILAVALDRFATQGIATTSMEDVAESAGISRPGLIHHFKTKDLLIAEAATSFARAARTAHEGGDLTEYARTTDYTALSTGILSLALTDPSSRALTVHHRDLMAAAEARSGARTESPRALVAGWEGLHVLSAYFPEIDPAEVLRARRSQAPCSPGTRITGEPVPIDVLAPSASGYANGQTRRRQIIEDASVLFARNGYHGTTVRQLSAEVGITASTLLHHFGDKAGLLAEVLRDRDAQLVGRRESREIDPPTELGEIGAEARRDIVVERGLIDLYAVLSTEAIQSAHPAHDYFANRFARTIEYFESLLDRAGTDESAALDPHIEAIWLVAMWDGLQYQLVLDPDGLDLPAELDAHIANTFGIAPHR